MYSSHTSPSDLITILIETSGSDYEEMIENSGDMRYDSNGELWK